MAEQEPLMGKDAKVQALGCELCENISAVSLEEVNLCRQCESVIKTTSKHRSLSKTCKQDGKCGNKCGSCKARRFYKLVQEKEYIFGPCPVKPISVFGDFKSDWPSKDYSFAGKGRGLSKAEPTSEGQNRAQAMPEGLSKAEPTTGLSKDEPRLSKDEPRLSKDEPTTGLSKDEPTTGLSKTEATSQGQYRAQAMPKGLSKAKPKSKVAGQHGAQTMPEGLSKAEPTTGLSKVVPTSQDQHGAQTMPEGSTYVIDKLEPGYSYKLNVIAKSDSQDECKSDELMVNVPIASVPGQCMFKISECPQPDTFVVFWEKALPNGSPIKFYKISYSQCDSQDFNPVSSATVAPSDNLHYNLRNLRPGTCYQLDLEAYNDIGSSTINRITFSTATAENIKTKPYLDLMMPQLKHVGERLVLKVQILGIPKPTVQWTKDAKELAGNAEVSQSGNTSTLEIENVSLTDAGFYAAHAGDESSSVEVQVIDASLSLEHDYQLFEITINEDLYHKIVAQMNGSMINYQIHKMYKIKNKSLWDKYVSSYKHFESECGSANEKALFYGCPSRESVLKFGFDPKLASKSDKHDLDHKVFCFSESAAAANEYAFDEKQCEHERSEKMCFECVRYMFLVRVVLGREQSLDQPMILPKSGGYYHSISAVPKNKAEKEILIINGEQAYCDVLIEYVMCKN